MPNAPKTPQRVIRLEDELWDKLGHAADGLGSDRSAVLRQLLSWWLRRPGVKMPPRPPHAD
jgi:hypothetical protein